MRSDSLNGGRDKGLVKTDTIYGLVVSFEKEMKTWTAASAARL